MIWTSSTNFPEIASTTSVFLSEILFLSWPALFCWFVLSVFTILLLKLPPNYSYVPICYILGHLTSLLHLSLFVSSFSSVIHYDELKYWKFSSFWAFDDLLPFLIRISLPWVSFVGFSKCFLYLSLSVFSMFHILGLRIWLGIIFHIPSIPSCRRDSLFVFFSCFPNSLIFFYTSVYRFCAFACCFNSWCDNGRIVGKSKSLWTNIFW